MQHAYLTDSGPLLWSVWLTIDWGTSEETCLAALWHFPLNKERKRESQQRFDFTYAWQCRSLHIPYAVIFYSSATLEDSYFMSTVVCECLCVSVCWCRERFGGYRVFFTWMCVWCKKSVGSIRGCLWICLQPPLHIWLVTPVPQPQSTVGKCAVEVTWWLCETHCVFKNTFGVVLW